jgi:hypothetical protein
MARRSQVVDFLIVAILVLWTPFSASSSEVRDGCDSSEAHTRGRHRKASTGGIASGRHVHDDASRPQVEAHHHPLRGISPPGHQLYGGDGQVSSQLCYLPRRTIQSCEVRGILETYAFYSFLGPPTHSTGPWFTSKAYACRCI